MQSVTFPCRLSLLFARDAPRAVIFRRGPSKQVRLILWKTDTDTFEGGQWLKGRIYPEKCHLSPDGKYLIYFAGNFKYPHEPETWTAISRPPYLTALAFWAQGDTWQGGGQFTDNRTVSVNLRFGEFDSARPTPDWLTVNTTCDTTLKVTQGFVERTGWTLTQNLLIHPGEKPPVSFIREPAVWKLRYSDGETYLRLIQGLPDENWWKGRTDRFTLHRPGRVPERFQAEQAFFDQQGRVTVLRDGQLWVAGTKPEEPLEFSLLADFNDQTFEPIVAPEWATRWDDAPPLLSVEREI